MVAALATESAQTIECDTDVLANLPENQQRRYLRGELARHNQKLAEAAQQVGVVTSRDFAVFQNYGYMGLYGGLR